MADRVLQARLPVTHGLIPGNYRDVIKPKNDRTAILYLVIAQGIVSLFWLSQGGFFIVKDTYSYLAMATRALELPFLVDCTDKFRAGAQFSTIVTPYYVYLIDLLQKLPGGFAPYHFVLTQAFHLGFIIGLYMLARLWRGVGSSLLIALLCLLEPLHHADVLAIKTSFSTQATIGISICLAAYGWKKKSIPFFAAAAATLGFGYIFRALHIIFLPAILLLILPAKKTLKWKASAAIVVIGIVAFCMLPKAFYFWRNPHLSPLTFKESFGMFAANRVEQFKQLHKYVVPRTMAYYYSLAPRLKDRNLVSRFAGTSMPFFHAFVHERVYRYGDDPSEALKRYGLGGIILLGENPAVYVKSTIKLFGLNWGLPSRSSSDPPPYQFQLRLWTPVEKGKQFFSMPEWGHALLRMYSCSDPFEECMDRPPQNLISPELIASLRGMPSPGYFTYVIGKTWNWMSPVKGMFAFFLLVISVLRLAVRKEWDVVLVSGATISIYLGMITLLTLATTGKIVMVLPWIVWTAGMAFSSGKYIQGIQFKSRSRETACGVCLPEATGLSDQDKERTAR